VAPPIIRPTARGSRDTLAIGQCTPRSLSGIAILVSARAAGGGKQLGAIFPITAYRRATAALIPFIF